MNEKVVLITGSTSGIGYYTALELARMGARVVVHGRDEARCIASVRAIQDETRNASITYLLADFSSQTQVRSMSGDFLDRHDHLEVVPPQPHAGLVGQRGELVEEVFDGLVVAGRADHPAVVACQPLRVLPNLADQRGHARDIGGRRRRRRRGRRPGQEDGREGKDN